MGELEIRSSADEAGREPGFFDLTGREIGRYRIQKRLGRGGVTTVYQAYDIVDDIPVALKVLLHGNDEKLYNRFRQEAQTAAKLLHPHIVRTLRVGVTPGSDTAYIAMELVEGEDLAAMLAMRRRLTPEESCLLLQPIALALAYAHEQGIVHRDVKPSNILLRAGVNEITQRVVLDTLDYPVVPLLGDFGIARALDLPELTSMGRTVGTPAFMAPEQAQGQRNVDHRADIYALGAVLYRCITGRPPFSGTTVQILHAHVYDSVTISEEVQRQLSQRHVQLLQRSLAKDPNDRYESALAMAEDLRRGSDPKTDELSVAEREIGTTLTLELVSVGRSEAKDEQQNVLIPAEGHRRGAESDSFQPMPPGVTQAPLDPHFDPELDQRLQRWVWIILTIVALGSLYYLLGSPFPFLKGALNPFGPSVRALSAPNASILPAGHISTSDGTINTRLVTPVIPEAEAFDLPGPMAIQPTEQGQTAPRLSIPTATMNPFGTPPASTPHSPTEPMLTPPPIPTTISDVALPVVAPELLVENLPLAAPLTTDGVRCSGEIDRKLYRYVLTLERPLRDSFRCATEQAVYVQGQYLYFEYGFMLYIPGAERMFISYHRAYDGIDRPWEDINVTWLDSRIPDTPAIPLAPEDLRFYPPKLFRVVWSKGQVQERLGMAMTPKAVTTALIAQKFNRGWLILREPTGKEETATYYAYPGNERLL